MLDIIMSRSPVVKKPWLLGVLLLTLASSGHTHPRYTDPMLTELNDYLMALQVLRTHNPQAEELFQLWQRVREESWKIRELTDEQDLPSDAPAVVRQIQKTHASRQELLRRCRQFLSAQKQSMPTIHFQLGKTIKVHWSDPLIETPVWSRTVVLIEVENRRKTETRIDLFSDPSDQILFWKKSLEVDRRSSRYTFAYVAPSKEGLVTTTLYLREGHDRGAEVSIRAEGTPPPPHPSNILLPGDDIYTVKLPEGGMTLQGRPPEVMSPDQSIRFRIRDRETQKPLPVRIEVRDENGKAFWTPLHGPGYAVSREEVGDDAWELAEKLAGETR